MKRIGEERPGEDRRGEEIHMYTWGGEDTARVLQISSFTYK